MALSPFDIARADLPNIAGTYSGSFSGTEECPPEAPVGYSGNVNFYISQSNGNFTGSGSGTIGEGGTGTFSFSGTVDPNGNVSGSITIQEVNPRTLTGTFSGTFRDNTLNLSFNLFDLSFNLFNDGSPPCQIIASGTFNRITGGAGGDLVVDPEVTPGSTLTAPLLLNTQVKAVTTNLGTRIGDVLRGRATGFQRTATGLMLQGTSGLNAGDEVVRYGAWTSYAYSDFENDFVSTAFNGQAHTALAGFDFAPWESTVFGLALGYETSDIDTGFNLGNQETDGYTVAPYFGALLTDTWSVDFSFGYSNLDYDQFRTDPITTTRITSSPGAERWFGMLNLNGLTTWQNWILGGRIGTLWAKNTVESFVESDGTVVAETKTKLGQWLVGGDVAYSLGEFEPFVRATYERAYSLTEIAVVGGPQPANDRDNVLFGAGVRYFGANGLSGNLEWNKRLGYEDFDEDTISLTIRAEF